MTQGRQFHEDFGRQERGKAGSDRAFGIVFAVAFAVVAAWPLMHGGPVRWWAVAVAGVFLVLALAVPKVLYPLNLVWFEFGLLLHKVVSPLVMGLLFFLTLTPLAFLMRLAGKDPLRLRFDPKADSYWIHRDPPGPPPETMRNQF
ncbi:MAG: hypothetical protein H6907_02470 [Hyphomicrobiales bacterium]|nr:hypothetical protein [Hyphomicrobiales bacterium]